jgi:CyaY protein
MNEAEFLGLVELVFDRLEEQIDAWLAEVDVDLDMHRHSNVLTLIFEEDQAHIIITTQAALKEIWVAAPSGGFHYRYDGHHWVDTKAGMPLHEALSLLCSEFATNHDALTLSL